MSRFNGNRGEMDDLGNMTDADLERLLSGKTPASGAAGAGGKDADALKAFFHELKSAYVTEPPAGVRQAHLSQIMSAAQLQALQGGPASSPLPQRSGAPGNGGSRWKHRLVASGIFGSVTAKLVLAGMVAATAATGGLAAAGDLPRPVQQAVAGAAGSVGVKLPNPQASAAAAANAQAQVQAAKVASTVLDLVQQVSTAAQRPPKLTNAAVASTQTCTQNVTTIAGQLVNAAVSAETAAAAQSLAERATALAQEAVGCALPNATVATGAAAKVLDPDASADGPAAMAISGAVQACAGPLAAAIRTLVQAAITARTPAQVQGLAQDAKTVAADAQACAQSVSSALQGVLATLPSAKLKTSTGTTAPTAAGTSGLLNLVPGLSRVLPTPLPTTAAGAGASASAVAEWWKQFLSSLPASMQARMQGQTQVTGTVSGSGSWSGLTGSWNGSGSWSPYGAASTGTPTPTDESSGRHR